MKLELSDIKAIQKLVYYSNETESANVILELLCQSEGVYYILEVMFVNVHNFTAKFPGTSHTQVTGFNIVDISERQYEKLNFMIEDFDDDTVSFYCYDYYVVQRTNL